MNMSLVSDPLAVRRSQSCLFTPTYKHVLKRTEPECHLVLVWSDESIQCLQDCFSCTDWDLFKDVCSNLDELTETDCEDSVIQFFYKSIFCNNKPWVSKSVKNIITQRNSFNQGDDTRWRKLQKQVKKELKLNYKVAKAAEY